MADWKWVDTPDAEWTDTTATVFRDAGEASEVVTLITGTLAFSGQDLDINSAFFHVMVKGALTLTGKTASTVVAITATLTKVALAFTGKTINIVLGLSRLHRGSMKLGLSLRL